MINDKEIADWVNECPTHKIEVLYSDENGIQLLVNFNNYTNNIKISRNYCSALHILGCYQNNSNI